MSLNSFFGVTVGEETSLSTDGSKVIFTSIEGNVRSGTIQILSTYPTSLSVSLNPTYTPNTFTLYQQGQPAPIYQTTANGITPQLSPNQTYLFTLSSTGVGANEILLELQANMTPIVTDFIPSGWENQLVIDNLTTFLALDAYGNPTYTFVNYPVVASQQINLTDSNEAVQSANVTVTSSDTTFFGNQSLTFDPPSGIQVYILPLKTGTFSGTQVINISGTGTPTNLTTYYTRQ